MARTNIPANSSLVGSYPAVPLSAGAADVTETAVDDPTDRMTSLIDNKTYLLAHNTDTVARTITIGSTLDSLNRKGDITAYSIAAGKLALFGPFRTVGWSNGGNLNIDVSDPKVRLAVLTLPPA